MPFLSRRPPSGFSSLLIILIVSAAAFLAVMTFSVTSIQELKNSIHQDLSGRVFSWAEECLEYGLMELNRSPAYAGGNLVLGGLACVITVSDEGGSPLVRASASQGSLYKRTLEALIDLSNGFHVVRWRERVD